MFLSLAGCSSKTEEVSPYADYDCEKLFKGMDYKVAEANLLFINYEDEDSGEKILTGTAVGAAGAAMTSALVLTPLGWAVAGLMMFSGASDVVDGVFHGELSEAEERKLWEYKKEYEEMKEMAISKKCDYYEIPKWDVSEEAAKKLIERREPLVEED